MSVEPESVQPAEETDTLEKSGWTTLRMVTWFAAGMAVAALGLYIGNEIRCRAKFRRRTPYDFYSHAGERQTSEFGMGI